MINLAGNKDCDKYITDELNRARINIVQGERSKCEVAASITGELNGFTFVRAWYYWVVEGDMPVTIARELYNDPIGKTDIRVDGHCECPAPEGNHIRYFASDDKEYINVSDKDFAFLQDINSSDKYMHKVMLANWNAKYYEVENPNDFAVTPIIDSYHIDTMEGLRLFADTITRYNIVSNHAERNEKIAIKVKTAIDALGPKPESE